MEVSHILLFVVFPLLSFASEDRPVFVNTTRGRVRGFHAHLGFDNLSLYYGHGDVFIGIPYALPPVGELRFKLPKPICKYKDEIVAIDNKPRCPQTSDWNDQSDFEQSEDCLFLNIYSPDSSHKGRYPVMFYIPGGGFKTGGANLYEYKGSIRNLVSRGVVVVVIQYRLGMLGFFSTFTPDFPANRGMYDMIMALRWVQEEIEHFGGDPTRVTIFGESSGGGAVSALSFSPLVRGLFGGYIQQSGGLLQQIGVPNDVRGEVHSTRIKQICNLTVDKWLDDHVPLDAIKDCLDNKTAVELVAFDNSDTPSWCNSVDGIFLPDVPSVLARSRPPIPAMIGDTADEYAFSMPEFHEGNLTGIGPWSIRRKITNYLGYVDNATLDHVALLMQDWTLEHPLDVHDFVGWTVVYLRALTGLTYGSMRRDATWKHDVGTRDLYLYTFNHSSPVCKDMHAGPWRPVGHTAELCFLWFNVDSWTEAANASRISPIDLVVADNVGRAWSNFAKNWNPGWPRAGNDYTYAIIDAAMNKTGKYWREAENRLYNLALPNLLGGYPLLVVSDDTARKLREEGAKVLADWSQSVCDQPKEAQPDSTSLRSVSAQFMIVIAAILIVYQ